MNHDRTSLERRYHALLTAAKLGMNRREFVRFMKRKRQYPSRDRYTRMLKRQLRKKKTERRDPETGEKDRLIDYWIGKGKKALRRMRHDKTLRDVKYWEESHEQAKEFAEDFGRKAIENFRDPGVVGFLDLQHHAAGVVAAR